MNPFLDVLAFHRKFGCLIGGTPSVPDPDAVGLRVRLIEEECRELAEVLASGDLPAIAKEAADLIYVVTGTLIAFGIDPRPVWAAVHAANMTKDGSKRGDGKVTKGTAYRPPDVAGLLAAQPPIPAADRGEMSDGERAALLELEHRIASTVRAEVIGIGLREIRDRDLYRGTHPTFEAYVAEVWKYSLQVSQLFIDCAEPDSRYAKMSRKIDRDLLSPAPLKHAEKRAFVLMCLRDADLSRWTNAGIAARCDASESFVAAVRRDFETAGHGQGVGLMSPARPGVES